MLRNVPIKRKLTVIMMLTSVVALLLACVAFATYEQVNFRRRVVLDLSIIADMTGANSAAGLTFNDAASAEQTLSSLRAHPHITRACVYDKNGQPFAKFERGEAKASFSPPLARTENHKFGPNEIDVFRSILLAGEKIGTIYIQSDLHELRDRVWRYVLIVGAISLAGSLVAFALASRLQQIISRPIADLAETAALVAAEKDYAVRAVKQGDDEIGRLIDGFNEMLAQIQARDTALQAARDALEKRVEERTRELTNSLSLLSATLDSMADGILAVDLAGNVICYNRKFAAMWALPDEMLNPGNYSKLVAHISDRMKDPEHYLKRVQEIQTHAETEAFDVLELKDGRIIERYQQPQRIGNDCVGRVLNFRDITERRRAEEARKQSEAQFRQVWNASADGLRLVDEEGIILTVNDAFCRIVGKAKAELEGRSFSMIYDAGERDRVLIKHRAQFNSTTGPAHVEREVTLSGGRKMWVEVSNSLLQLPGQRPLLLSIFRDISGRKRAEAELEGMHRRLLETSRQAGMAEVATAVLHNVGNVLNSVNVSATLVTDSLKNSRALSLSKVAELIQNQSDPAKFFSEDPRGKQLPAYLAQLASYIKREQSIAVAELEMLRKHIDHIKDIVAMQQGYAKVSGVTETVNPTELVEDALRMNAAALTRHDVHVIREFEKVPDISVEKHKVLQILVNLIRNAKYACDESGRPDKRLTMRVARGRESVDIQIIDNGVGIPEENLTRIFGHGFTTRKDGHGFGLHSGALAAKEIGGELRVHSDGPGHGATFTLKLPVQVSTSLTA